MLSGLQFVGSRASAAEVEAELGDRGNISESKKRNKSSKEKSSKKHSSKSSSKARHRSPSVEAQQDTLSPPVQTNPEEEKEWGQLIEKVALAPETRTNTHQADQACKTEESKSTAKRLPMVSDPDAGRVGDGGQSWRKKLQMYQTQRHHAGERCEHTNQDFKESRWNSKPSHEGMRRPRSDAISAFKRPGQRDVKPKHSRQHDANTTPQPRSSGAEGTNTAREVRDGSNNREGAGNFSAAAMLRAQLRGENNPKAKAPSASNQEHTRFADKPPMEPRGRSTSGQRGSGRAQVDRSPQQLEGMCPAELAKTTRLGDGIEDMDQTMARNITSKRKFNMNDLDPDDEHDFDVGVDLHKKRQSKQASAHQPKTFKPGDAIVPEHITEKCRLCFTSKKRDRSLSISVACHTYLALPARGSLVPGHVVIVPAEHVASMRKAEPEVEEEVKNYKKCLIRLFESQERCCIFFETALRVKDFYSHTVVECVPVSKEAFSSAPLVVKREIDTAESEWSQHHAKRLIDTSVKGLNGCIPENFPYFHIEFGYKKGFVHVIDDEHSWDRNFGRSVVASIAGSRDLDVYGKAKLHSGQSQSERKHEFMNLWKKWDWTNDLD